MLLAVGRVGAVCRGSRVGTSGSILKRPLFATRGVVADSGLHSAVKRGSTVLDDSIAGALDAIDEEVGERLLTG